MTYTKKQFAERLSQQLVLKYDVTRIARWAYNEFTMNCREIEPGLEREMMKIIVMEEGPEFEMTEQEIREFVRSLAGE
jgi:hypothetical protein